MQQLWRIELFGGLRLRSSGDQGREINRFRRERAGALLAYLAYHLHRSHPRELLIELLWPDSETGARQNSFRVALSSLRRQLEPPGVASGSVLITDRNSIRLNPAAVSTDIADFEAYTKAAAVSNHELERIKLLTDALDLYQGPLLAGSFDEWVMAEQSRLESLVLQTLRDLVKLLKQVGDIPRAIEHTQRAMSFDPEYEEGINLLMELYVLDGQPSTALRHYSDFVRNLWKKYNARPSAATQERAEQLSRQLATGGGERHSQANGNLSMVVPPAPPRKPRQSNAKRAAESIASLPAAAPSGTVTFLLLDISVDKSGKQGSADTVEKTSGASSDRQYRELVCQEVSQYHGYAVRATADSLLFAFARAGEALSCALVCLAKSRPKLSTAGNDVAPSVLRAALFTRDAEFRDGTYHDCSYDDLERILLAAHPGQIVCAADTAALLRTQNYAKFQLVNLGFFRLSGVEEPVNIFQINSEELAPNEFPPLNLPAVHSGNVPIQYNSFFGRESEINQLSDMLVSGKHRLITLTGMGGSGKTRLVLELARRLMKPWRGEVWFVSLSDLSDPQLIVNAIRDALRLPPLPHTSPLEQVVDMLSRQPSLLLLDNFEHMVEQGTGVVELLRDRIPDLTLLITSQQRLNLVDEEEYRVDTLPTPQEVASPAELVRNPSVQLFVDRAQAVRSDFQVTESNAREVATLCKHLDGIPLAIELAAARATSLTPAQMMVRLAEHGLDSFVNPRRNAVQRQRTLRAALDWSHELLPPPVRQFFNQLAVFRGGWTLEAAEQVTMIPESQLGSTGNAKPARRAPSLYALDYLDHLTSASLVLMEDDGPLVRYRMLETIHQYAIGQLEESGDLDELNRQHAQYYLAMAEAAEPELQGPGQSEWMELLYREQENLRAALEWAMGSSRTGATSIPLHQQKFKASPVPFVETVELQQKEDETPPRDIETALRLVNALGLFWELHGHVSEGRMVLERVLERSDNADPALRATALFHAGRLALFQNDFAQARACLERNLELRRSIGDKHGIGLSLSSLGVVMMNQNDLAEAVEVETQALEILREVGDTRNAITALNAIAGIALIRNQCDVAWQYLEEGLVLLRELGDRRGEALSLNTMGAVAMTRNDLHTARELMEQSLIIMRELGGKWGIAIALNSLGFVTMNLGDLDTARNLLEEGLPIFRELGVKGRFAEALCELGDVARCQGDHEEAASLYSKSLALYEEMEFPSGVAWVLRNLGWISCHRGETDRAAKYFSESLSMYVSLDSTLGIVHGLAGIATILAVSGEGEKAARLLGAAEAMRESITTPMFVCEQSDHKFTMAALKASLDETQLKQAWAQGREMTLSEVLALAKLP